MIAQLQGIANCVIFEETREGFWVGYAGDMKLVSNGQDSLITVTDRGKHNGRAASVVDADF